MGGNDLKKRTNSASGRALFVVVVALCVLGLLSALPWSRLTNGRLKDFSLFSDILCVDKPVEYVTEEIVDFALVEAMKKESESQDSSKVSGQTVTELDTVAVVNVPYYNPRVDGMMVLEDFSNGEIPDILKAAASCGRLRCAMIGDSYIEGDILSGTIRRKLQDRFGGEGVGYVPMTSAVAGFRRTVRISSDGFSACDIRNDRLDSLHTLPGEYFRAEIGAKATFRGEKGGIHTAEWSRSRLIFLAPSDGVIRTSTDGKTWVEHAVVASSLPQCIDVETPTSRFDIDCNVDGLVVFGAWLDARHGATYDCMSLRGYSGISHRGLSVSTARNIAGWVDYDLIVVEYGMNALSSQQSEYSAYGNIMRRVLLRIKACYPHAAIVMLGVGDRGQKQGTEIASLPTIRAIVAAQRNAAREAGVMFWDMREAMGGEGSIVDWRERGLVNADYIHLNHKGGEEMGAMFVESLMRVLDE